MPLRRLLFPAAALVLSACSSRLFHIPGPTPYERMSMIDCAADVASARGFAVRERRLNEGFLVAEGAWTQAAGGEVARSGDDGTGAAAGDESHVDVLTVAVSRESTLDPIAVQAETFVVRDAEAAAPATAAPASDAAPAPAKESRLRRGARAALGWARPSARVVDLRSRVLDRCGSLAAPRRR